MAGFIGYASRLPMKKSPLVRLSPLVLLAAVLPLQAQDRAALGRSLTLHASFDHGLNADFSRGDRTFYSHSPAAPLAKGGMAGLPNDEVKIDQGAGRFGDALWFTKKGNVKPFFKGPGILDYNDKNWSGTVSVWLRLNPDVDLEPGYCDPVQIVGHDGKKGFIFLEWSKDENPRLFRYAIRPLFHIWNPTNVPWGDIPFAKRPMVQVARAPFSREKWTHVVFTYENINDKAKKPVGKLYIEGQLQGAIENWDLTFGWEANKVLLTLGSAYIGWMDELAAFDRALSTTEVKVLYGLKNGIRELY
jgi:hypothetical protein